VHFVPSLCFNLALLRLHIYSCNHLLNAQYLAVCNLCQVWVSNELYLDYKFVFVVTCYMHNYRLCAHCAKHGIQSSTILTFCNPSMCAHGLADGSWSLSWALMQASGCLELMFWWMFAEYWLIMQPYLALDLYVVTSISISWCSLIGRVW
jgi:hypothetical protein